MGPEHTGDDVTAQSSAGSIRVPPVLVDSALAVVVAIGAAVEAIRVDDQRALVLVVGAVTAVAVAVRRRAPMQVAAIVLAGFLAVVIAERDPGALVLGPMIAIYTVGERVTVRAAIVLGFGSLVAAGVIALLDDGVTDVLIAAALVISPLAVGQAVASRRAYVAELQSRLAAVSSARDAEIDQALVAERVRIARDLHDVIAHTVAVVNVQSSVALKHAAHIEPAADALGAIRSSSSQALDELRVMLRVLRSVDGDDVAPASVESLLQVIDGAGDAGLRVHAEFDESELERLPPGALAVARRVVQEGVTNVIRHSAARTVEIGLDATDDGLIVRVTDAGPRRTGTTVTGVGLTGLRDRVVLHGGSLVAGPRELGFELRAEIPLAGESGAPSLGTMSGGESP